MKEDFMLSQAQKLRDLIDRREHFIAADAYSALTGRIVERVGFKAAYLGGHSCSAFHYAIPDNGIFSQVEQLEQATRIAAAVNIPLIVDADTLGESVADAFHFTRRYERAGLAGFHVEDEVNPKHSSYAGSLLPVVDMQSRLEACVKARQDPAFVIIARCDELFTGLYRGGGTGSIEEAVRRGRAYAEAGADVLVYPGATAEASAALVRSLTIPICVLGPTLPGAAFTLHTGWGWTGAAQLHLERARKLMETGSLDVSPILEGKEQLIEQDLYDALIGEWAKKTSRPVR
jgi:2-methylisocitrate lyase-like PEP mutase family enzyme